MIAEESKACVLEDSVDEVLKEDYSSCLKENDQRNFLNVALGFENKLEVWFHGRLTREEAEVKLKTVNQVGAFLIRESGSLPKTFALSFLKSPDEIVHFRITVVCGEYFADDKKFDSLVSLVDYYASRTEICPGNFLTLPVGPEQTMQPTSRKVVAVVSFRGMKDSDELSFVKGEIFTVIEEMGGNWLWVVADRSNDKGLVYEGLVEDLTSESLAPIDLPYFYDNLDTSEAAFMLAKAGKGSFLVKQSDTCSQNFTLMVCTNQKVQKVAIRTLKSGRYEVAGRTFKSLHDVIERYSHSEICDDVKLLKPLYKCLQVPDSNNTLDVELYKKLRLNRFSYNTIGGKVSKSGYLYKKCKSEDKWRYMFFLLKEMEGQLFIYDNEKHTKPKSVLDLCHCSYYDVHESLFNQTHCFQIILHGMNKPVVFYFYSESEREYEEWREMLIPLCCGHRQRFSSPFSYYRKMSSERKNVQRTYSLGLKLFEARFDNVKHVTDIFATLSINCARIYRTSAYVPQCNSTAGSILLQEDVVFENLCSELYTVALQFFGKSRRTQRQTELGSTNIELSSDSMMNCTTKDLSATVFRHEWLKLKYKEAECGQCRINLTYIRRVIMPVEEYGSLFEVLKSNNFDVCCLLSRYLCDDEKHQLAFALINIFDSNYIYLHLIIKQLELEVLGSGESACLFRKTSFASILVYELLNRDAIDFVRQALKEPIAKIIECKFSLEVDSRKLQSNGIESLTGCNNVSNTRTGVNICQNNSNTSLLIDLAKDVCKSINSSSLHFPRTLQFVMNHLRTDVAKRWPEDSQISMRSVSAFLFLRLICLALLDPKKYGIVTESPSDVAQRNLLLVTRLVQKAANVRERKCCASPEDDDYDLLESISCSYVDSKLYISQFIDAVSCPCSLPPDASLKRCDIAPHFAAILSLSQKYIDQIRTEPVQRVSAFLSVIEMLQNHLNKYIEDDTKLIVQSR